MRGIALKCAVCETLRIIPKSKSTYIDGLRCEECRGNLIPLGPVDYGIDYGTNTKNENTSHKETVTEAKEEIAFNKIFRIKHDDILILKTSRIIRKEDMIVLQKDISEQTGVKVALFDGRSDIVGVVEHGT